MKQHVDVLLQDFFEDLDLLKILPGVGLQVSILSAGRVVAIRQNSFLWIRTSRLDSDLYL